MNNMLEDGKRIHLLINEIRRARDERKKIFDELNVLKKRRNEKIISENEYAIKVKGLLKNRPEREFLEEHTKKINLIIDQIKEQNSKIYEEIQKEKTKEIAVGEIKISKEQLKKYLKELNVTQSEINRFIEEQKKKKIMAYENVEYSIYKSSEFGKMANRFFEPLSVALLKKYPDLFSLLLNSLKLVNLNMLSKTYVSIMLFLGAASFVFFSLLFSLIFLNIVTGIAIGIVMLILSLVFVYYYPSSMIGTRKRKIKDELPFAIVHMAAVAGSGTQPINIFKLLVESLEYPEIGKEMKKILNYVYIFGYSLSTSLKNVADGTPSTEFRELLNGIISTIETGGDLRNYLDNKAVDSLATYRLDRKKYVETLATYSDIYTGILVAAPLLFVTTLTIINVIGGNLGGLSVTTIALFGTFGFIPALNIGFIIFLNLTQPEL